MWVKLRTDDVTVVRLPTTSRPKRDQMGTSPAAGLRSPCDVSPFVERCQEWHFGEFPHNQLSDSHTPMPRYSGGDLSKRTSS